MTSQNVVRMMMMMGNASRGQESLVKHGAIIMKAYREADNSTFGHVKEARVRKQTDGKKMASKRIAAQAKRAMMSCKQYEL